mmetsp:Transcript_318/g.961  ORF Transcript_318/g.961 Transcript_318/m.961 type:complete len:97 (+) Transcript_318:18-308(+)
MSDNPAEEEEKGGVVSEDEEVEAKVKVAPPPAEGTRVEVMVRSQPRTGVVFRSSVDKKKGTGSVEVTLDEDDPDSPFRVSALMVWPPEANEFRVLS